jgi:hypothetical protein
MRYEVLYDWNDGLIFKAQFENIYDAKLFGRALESDSSNIKDLKALHIEYKEVTQ